MSRLITNIRIISRDDVDFAYFMDQEDLYSKLSGVKDDDGDDMEFIEIGNKIKLNENTLLVKNINLKMEPIDINEKHIEKTTESMPSNFRVEVIITVENLPLKV